MGVIKPAGVVTVKLMLTLLCGMCSSFFGTYCRAVATHGLEDKVIDRDLEARLDILLPEHGDSCELGHGWDGYLWS